MCIINSHQTGKYVEEEYYLSKNYFLASVFSGETGALQNVFYFD